MCNTLYFNFTAPRMMFNRSRINSSSKEDMIGKTKYSTQLPPFWSSIGPINSTLRHSIPGQSIPAILH